MLETVLIWSLCIVVAIIIIRNSLLIGAFLYLVYAVIVATVLSPLILYKKLIKRS